ncbi:MAG: Asp-tRNA(Asn)/Glu-tRNA(Gln) amidotransferase subunit GatB [Oscillospiraceae bacterium]|jgi:aspartyl-tRNA(Asn)/glutamyl-tRNA(Gln) amidotransferase subunit B|nr:Asp-tRNA(Asn)/Glu-tRNA(Gln) amidotransferase subunit GatB [Oscillospiraceae bacterium]
MRRYEVVMGLEVHAELATETKLFCSCPAKFGGGPNEHVCPACSGAPGMPAVANRRAVELGIAAAIVTNSEITPVMTFDKKNYFYPDLPTGYQITQITAPICRNGRVEIETGAGAKTITLKQIHIEEDAGKLIHDARSTLVDFNRTSVPLVEIVSNADFRTAAEVVAYLEKLRSLLSFAGVSDCKMQEGSMRCDVNLSVREVGSHALGVRAEIKNMNSLKAIAAAIEYEAQRHIDALETGSETLIQETRRWDDDLGETFPMREKENANDYRYFPNPEIMPIRIGEDWIERVRNSLPEPAHEKYARMVGPLGLPEADSRIITGSKNLSDIFDTTTAAFNNPKEVVHWIVVELLAVAKGDNKGEDDIAIDSGKFAKLLELVEEKVINRNVGKKLLKLVLTEGIDPEDYVRKNNLGLVNDTGAIDEAIRTVLSQQKKSVEEYRGGNEKVIGFLMGQVMRSLGGKADPKVVGERLSSALQF